MGGIRNQKLEIPLEIQINSVQPPVGPDLIKTISINFVERVQIGTANYQLSMIDLRPKLKDS